MEKHKKFNLSLLVVIPVFFATYFLSVNYLYFDNKNDSFSIETYFNYKDSLASSIERNKILFTSGSNNFLGIRAYQVEEAFNTPSVNMAIHAGLRAEYILHRLKRTAKAGDMVIIPFEYSNFAYMGEPSITLNKYLLSYDKAYTDKNYDFVERLKLLSSISLLDLFSSIIDGTTESEENEKRKVFLKNINRNGDMLNMTEHDSLKTKKNPFALPTPFNLETIGLNAIKEFNIYCKKNKIAFFVTFPNLVEEKVYANEKYQAYFNYLLEYFIANDIKVIGRPENAMYPRNLFFDSEYHLISEGSDIRTKDFIQMMKENKNAHDVIKNMIKNKRQAKSKIK